MGDQRKIVIIGASYLQVPIIRKAKEMGFETHSFAWEKGAVGKDISDYFYPISITKKDEILNFAENIRPDGIASIGSDLAMPTVNFLAAQLGLVGNSEESTLISTNKYKMREALSVAGLPCPKYCRFDLESDLSCLEFSFPVIVKPTDRSGSRGVTKVYDQEQLRGAINDAIDASFQKEALVEEFVDGVEVSVEMISWQGEHFHLQMTDKKTTGEPYYIEIAHHQPSKLPLQVQQEIEKIVKQSLTVLGVKNGASHSELKISSKGHLKIIEIGARMGGDFIGSELVRLSTGYDYVEGTVAVAVGEFQKVKKTEQAHSGVYFLVPDPGRVTRIEDGTSVFPQIVQKEIHVEVGDDIPMITHSGDRCGYYLYRDKQERFNPEGSPIHIVTR